VHELVQVKL